MNLETDDGVRDGLTQYAETTTTSSGAWDRILDRADRRHSRKRIGFTLTALTAAAAVIAAGVVWVARPGEEPADSRLLSAFEHTAAQGRFGVSYKYESKDGPAPQQADGQYDMQRGVGWLRTSPSTGPEIIFDFDRAFLPTDVLSSLAGNPPPPLEGLSPPPTPWVAFARDSKDSHLTMVLSGSGRYNLENVMPRLGSRHYPGLLDPVPIGRTTLIEDGREQVRGVPAIRYRIETDVSPEELREANREFITQEAARAGETDPAKIDEAVEQMEEVFGDAVPAQNTDWVWIDSEGLIRRFRSESVQPPSEELPSGSSSTDTFELYDFGQALRFDIPPASEVTDELALNWPPELDIPPLESDQGAATTGTLPESGSASAQMDPSFLTFRPVLRQLPPSCPAPAPPEATVLPELRDGAVVACYELAPPELDAGAVESAKAVFEENTGQWAVEFTLTEEGEDRWDAMVRKIGQGRQIAVVLHDQVLSAPTLETTDFGGRGVITGNFDEGFAMEVAGMLDAA
jgi:hypothetical protein